jgi:hypothetical protein
MRATRAMRDTCDTRAGLATRVKRATRAMCVTRAKRGTRATRARAPRAPRVLRPPRAPHAPGTPRAPALAKVETCGTCTIAFVRLFSGWSVMKRHPMNHGNVAENVWDQLITWFSLGCGGAYVDCDGHCVLYATTTRPMLFQK